MFTEQGTKVTWANPTITPESQRQNGGWYYNPATGSVDHWFTNPPASSSSNSPAPASTGMSDVTKAIYDKINSFDPNSFAKTQADESAKLTQQQQATQEARFTQDKNDISNYNQQYATTVPTVINNAEAKYDLPGLSNIVNALNTRIQTLQGNTDNSGAGGFANSSQVDAALQTNYLPRFLTAQTNQQNAAKLAQQDITNQLLPIQSAGQLLNDRIAREETNFSTEQQNQLDALLKAQASGAALTSSQLSTLADLATKEDAYTNALQVAGINNKYKEVPYGGGIYDTSSNSMVGGGGSGDLSLSTGGNTYDTSGNSAPSQTGNSPSLPGLQAFVSSQNKPNPNTSLGFQVDTPSATLKPK